MSFVSIAKDFLLLVKKELDPHTTQKSEIKVENFLSVSLFTPSHIQFAKYGRGPGKPPPINAILEWVKKKGVIIGNNNAMGTAYVIARSIGKKGTKNYVANAPNAMEEALEKHLQFYANRINAKHVDDTVINTNKEYDKHLKEIKVSI